MNIITKMSIIIVSALVLSGCSFHANRNRFIERVVTAHKLKNGDLLKIGATAPKPAWACKQVGIKKENWQLERTAGITNVGGGYGRVRDQAIDYANKHPGVNYAFIYIPNQASLLSLNVLFWRDARLTFYQCKYPPAVHKNPFKK